MLYKEYLKQITSNHFSKIKPFNGNYQGILLIRHDVDRKPLHALRMAHLETELGLVSTYYFRAKPQTFKPEIMKEIANLGHEIGYHYENLSDTRGNEQMALKDFEMHLAEFREHVEVKTISMHGRPLLPFDNRDLWKKEENHRWLIEKMGILGEVYLDIDYSDIAYINDTGRNWTQGKNNRRDIVNSKVPADFSSGNELMEYLTNKPHHTIVFQIHPERWSHNTVDWVIQYSKDSAINFAKQILK